MPTTALSLVTLREELRDLLTPLSGFDKVAIYPRERPAWLEKAGPERLFVEVGLRQDNPITEQRHAGAGWGIEIIAIQLDLWMQFDGYRSEDTFCARLNTLRDTLRDIDTLTVGADVVEGTLPQTAVYENLDNYSDETKAAGVHHAVVIWELVHQIQRDT